MDKKYTNIIVKKSDEGSAVEDVQTRLAKLGFLQKSQIDGKFGKATSDAIARFTKSVDLPETEDVTEKAWAKLVDATFDLGDRNLFLKVPYFHGNDVLLLQKALGTLGFQVRNYDGIFGPSTERALRRFQINMGLPSDGIAGSQTFIEIKNLQFTWSDKNPVQTEEHRDANVFWRAVDTLENNSICIFGTDEFTRDVATRISNLATATNPYSKILSSDAYSVAPSPNTLLLHITLPNEDIVADKNAPHVNYSETEREDYISESSQSTDGREQFQKRLAMAIPIAKRNTPSRLTIELPGKKWWDAGEDRSAQHFAITILDALCIALGAGN